MLCSNSEINLYNCINAVATWAAMKWPQTLIAVEQFNQNVILNPLVVLFIGTVSPKYCDDSNKTFATSDSPETKSV